MRRKRHYRGISVRLECGCQTVLSTSFYRIDARTRAVIVGGAVRAGVWCHEHEGTCQLVEVGPNVRL